MSIILSPIAYVKSTRSDMSDDYWGGLVSSIELTDRFSEEALLGIEDFSHLEIIFYFHKAADARIMDGAAHPRENPDWPRVGFSPSARKTART